MKTIGIISEYNPFHNGHKYHIQASKEACGADAVVCIMSGSFVQRGEPAIVDKWRRTQMALAGGADLVIELPFLYACQPAEIFAYGAVKIMDSLNAVDYLCFGSELGDTMELSKAAKLLANEPEHISCRLKENLELGVTYPKAMAMALESTNIEESTISNPNNILGIEYIKALAKLNSSIEPVAIKRIISNYNDVEISEPIASATAIRKEVFEYGLSEKARISLPQESFEIMNSLLAEGKSLIGLNNLSDMILYKLRSSSPEALRKYAYVKEGIEYRLLKSAENTGSSEELIEKIKTKRYTRTFIQRLLCHILLDVLQEDINACKLEESPVYIRVLGFNNKGKNILGAVKKSCEFPIITKVADFKSDNRFLNRLFHLDILSTDIYNLGHRNSLLRRAKEDFLRSPVYQR